MTYDGPILFPGGGNSLPRHYSLSGDPGAEEYRVTVKREVGGAASNLLHDTAREGDVFEMSMPCGDFTRQEGEEGSVFLGAGIGITALIGMVKDAVKRSEKVRVHYD
jgi:nitric oxide dioxygenase